MSRRFDPHQHMPVTVAARSHESGALPFELSFVGFYGHTFGFESHVHEDEYELHYLPKANCNMVTGNRRVHLADHSLTFTEPHVRHGTEGDGKSLIQWYYFRFRVNALGLPVIPHLRRAFEPRGAVRLGPPYEPRFREMLLQLKSESPLLQLAGQHLFCSLVLELASNGRKRSPLRTNGHIDELVRWMQSNLTEQLDLGMLAREIGISKSYLIRLFKLRTGSSPVQFFNRMKIESASDLLENTLLTVKQIAEQLGFCDEFYFSRVYKQFKGVSPHHFRRGRAPTR